MSRIPDINDNELLIAETALMKRYGETKDLQVVDTDIKLNSTDKETTECPALYWHDQGCHFIVVKTAEEHYRPQFSFREHEQYGTDTFEFDDLANCIMKLLQTKADHELSKVSQSG